MICYHFGPWWTRKGLVSSHQGSYSVAFADHGSKDEGSAVNQQEGGMSAQPVDIKFLAVHCV